MASEVKILEALFGPHIPTDQAAILPEILGHIRAIDDLLQGKSHQRARPRISDPAISGPINRRIVELYAGHGKDFPRIAAIIGQEFQVQISPDACRKRHIDTLARQEAYAALSGSAIRVEPEPVRTSPEAKELPIELPTDSQPVNVQDCSGQEIDATLRNVARAEDVLLPATWGQLIPRDAPVDPIVDLKPGQQVAQRPDDLQIEAIKKEALKLYLEGQDVKAIAEKLGVRWQWVRSICARASRPELPASQQTPRLITMSAPQAPEPEPKPEPEKKVPRTPMDARIVEMVEQGAMVHEICLVIERNFNRNYSTSEMAEKIRALQAGLQ